MSGAAFSPSSENQDCLQTLPNGPWGSKADWTGAPLNLTPCVPCLECPQQSLLLVSLTAQFSCCAVFAMSSSAFAPARRDLFLPKLLGTPSYMPTLCSLPEQKLPESRTCVIFYSPTVVCIVAPIMNVGSSSPTCLPHAIIRLT